MADTPDVEPEITLDDFNADEPAKTDPSPVKEEPKAKAEEKPEPKAEGKEETPKADDTAEVPEVPLKEEGEPEESEEAEDTENKPKGAEDRKAQLNTEIRDLVSQRNALKTEVEKANAEVYQPATEDELVDQGYTATDAKVESLRQEIEMSRYNDRVAEAQLTLSSESERVLKDFPLFNPDSESYDKELAQEAAQLLQANLITDPNTNQIIGSNVSPYQLYKTLARASSVSTVKGQIKGQEATEKQLASVDAQSSTSPPQPKADPLMDLWKSDD